MPRTALQRAAAHTAGALSLILLVACAEGYPPADSPVLNPTQLTPSERLSAMNRLGAHAHPDQRWVYTLADDCVLEVALDAKGQSRTRFALPLRQGIADTHFDAERRVYEVALSGAFGGARIGAPLLESAKWADAVLMRGLVQAIQQGCATP